MFEADGGKALRDLEEKDNAEEGWQRKGEKDGSGY